MGSKSDNMDEERIKRIEEGFAGAFGTGAGGAEPVYMVSAPGRVEILGNHTDHQRGLVISGAINLDTLGAVSRNNLNQARLYSEGYNPCMVHLSDLLPDKSAFGSTRSLVRGVAEGFALRGFKVGGFDAYVASDVPKGLGLSSSASFEAWIAAAINLLYCDGGVDPVEIAKICRYAENAHFGKPSGLQDQMACSIGGVLFIDFEDKEAPRYEKLGNILPGYAVCVVESGADHAGLTEHYSAITRDLHQISSLFGAEDLRHVDETDFIGRMPELRKKVGDRALLRAIHIYNENRRVLAGKEALERGDTETFLRQVRESGKSSFMYLQNVIVSGETRHQDLAVALAIADELLGDAGAFRLQGGGFAGTVEAFVPEDLLPRFISGMDNMLGRPACMTLSFRSKGAGPVNR